MSGGPTIAFMVKAPRPGLVKTRLARTFGRAQACAVYRWMVERQCAAFPQSWPVAVHFAPADAEGEMLTWLGSRYTFRPQSEGDLGARMIAAAGEAFASDETSGLVLVGADCPTLECGDFEAVGRHLGAGADVVFGPATDGGYYLLGMKRLIPELFAGVPWSSPDTLSTSLRICQSLELCVAMLEAKEDVDDDASLHRAVDAGLIPCALVEK